MIKLAIMLSTLSWVSRALAFWLVPCALSPIVILCFWFVLFISVDVVVCVACEKRFLHSIISGVENRICRKEKCIRQFVLNVAKNAKCHSSLIQADLFTAENATRNEDHHEDSKSKLTTSSLASFFLHFTNFENYAHYE